VPQTNADCDSPSRVVICGNHELSISLVLSMVASASFSPITVRDSAGLLQLLLMNDKAVTMTQRSVKMQRAIVIIAKKAQHRGSGLMHVCKKQSSKSREEVDRRLSQTALESSKLKVWNHDVHCTIFTKKRWLQKS
jgi:hypothetical protein